MKLSFVNIVIFISLFGLTTGCSGAGDSDSAPAASAPSASGATAACTAVEALDASLDKLEDSESMDEYRSQYAVVRTDFETLRSSSDGKYATETAAFESALDEFEASLASLGDGGLISGMLELAGDAAELVAAGDRLDDAIDCPGE